MESHAHEGSAGSRDQGVSPLSGPADSWPFSRPPPEAWASEPLLLALTRYMSQDKANNADLLQHIAAIAPE